MAARRFLPYLGLKLLVMPPTPNRDLPEVVSELTIGMHEMRSVLSVLNGLVDQLGQTAEKGFQELRQEFRAEMRQITDQLINAVSRSTEPLINWVIGHETRLNNLVNPQA
jgi:hypothetical protein